MTWIQTFSGRAVDPLDLCAADIDLRDVAHALSQLCRFTGHCLRFYSVAEHSVRVAGVLRGKGASIRTQRWGLAHDVAEAYLGDVAAPLKATWVWSTYREFEADAQRAVGERFDVTLPIPGIVQLADLRMCATEARDLMAKPPRPWGLGVRPYRERIEPWSAPAAERRFLAECRRLGVK